MSVILSSNVAHYHHAARALADAGRLRRYITGVVPRGRSVERLLPHFWRAKLAGRELPTLERGRVVSLTAPEVAQRLSAATRVLPRDRSVRLQNTLFDRLAARHVDRCDAFHFVSSIGLRSARKAKRLGALVVCDERAEHPDVQLRVLPEEYERLGIPYQPHVNVWADVVRAEYELADYLVVGSDYSKETYVDAGWASERVFVIPYGFEPELFAPSRAPRARGELVVLFCGQLTPRKGVHHLVEAFRGLELPSVRLVLVGPADPLLRRHVEAWAADERIEVVGEVPKIELPRYYEAADVFALPSVADAQPLTCLEAMASGLPAVVTTAMGSREIVRDGVEGFVVAPSDPEALAEALARLDTDRELLEMMSAAAVHRAAEYTWNAYRARFRALYDTLLTRDPEAAP
jgi:glycosyltransferase involved in cell wall biosynthesis